MIDREKLDMLRKFSVRSAAWAAAVEDLIVEFDKQGRLLLEADKMIKSRNSELNSNTRAEKAETEVERQRGFVAHLEKETQTLREQLFDSNKLLGYLQRRVASVEYNLRCAVGDDTLEEMVKRVIGDRAVLGKQRDQHLVEIGKLHEELLDKEKHLDVLSKLANSTQHQLDSTRAVLQSEREWKTGVRKPSVSEELELYVRATAAEQRIEILQREKREWHTAVDKQMREFQNKIVDLDQQLEKERARRSGLS